MILNKIHSGNAKDVLKKLPDKSVHCIVTSPPYYGLRDYGTAIWKGGNENCNHKRDTKNANPDWQIQSRGKVDNGVGDEIFKTSCPKCGARRIDMQIGLEKTPEAYVKKLVSVFHEAKRVLRDDGTLWLNIADTYAGSWGNYGGQNRGNGSQRDIVNGSKVHQKSYDGLEKFKPPTASGSMSNFSHFIHRGFEQSFFFVGNGNPIRLATERINVLLYDKAAPDLIFFPLLRIQSILIKEGNNYFGQIGHGFNSPIYCYFGISAGLFFSLPPATDFQVITDKINDWGIITTTSNLDTNTALKSAISFSKKCSKATFAIEVPGEPVSELISNIQPIGDTIVFDLISEGIININSVNQPVSFSDRFDWDIANVSNVFVIKPLLKQCFFFHKSGRFDIAVFSITHLFKYSFSGLIPYNTIYENARQDANEFAPKNEIGIPDLLKRALKRDGWICRQTIIWNKPNPMPESVTDRCTKSHEYIFLLSKAPKYYFDQDSIRRPLAESTIVRALQSIETQKGSERVPGKTNVQMTAVIKRTVRKGIDIKGGNQGKKTGIPAMAINGSGLKNHSGYHDANGNLIGDGTANKKSVWTVATMPFKDAHFATFPVDLIVDMIKAGCPEGGVILDPFIGAGTTGLVARKLHRNFIGIELNPAYIKLAEKRLKKELGLFI